MIAGAIGGGLFIGSWQGTSNFWDGTIDRVRLWTYTGSWLDTDLGDRALLLGPGDGGTLAPAVPEPSTFVLSALGLLGLGLVNRRRRKRA